MFNRYYDDFQVGDTYVTKGRTITEADIVNFCYLSGDWNPLHSDAEFCKEQPFKQRIAHGMLVLSAAGGLVPMAEGTVAAFYGMEKVRFVHPTFAGDTIRVHLRVTEKVDKGPGGVIAHEFVVRNQRGEDAIVALFKALMNRRSA